MGVTLQYDIEKKNFSELKGSIEIPKFQRGLVWGEKKKEEFIKTLKSGLPIGVLLLSKNGDKYQIVDGLQRFTTMMDYDLNPFKYIQSTEITDMDLLSIVLSSNTARKIYNEYEEFAKEKNFESMRTIIVESITEGYGKDLFQIALDASEKICKKIAMFPDNELTAIMGSIYKVVDRIHTESKIDDIEIPLIIFKGKKEDLAIIFQKLNQEGVKLSKYDVFAATWINSTVVVKDDPAFIDFIINKYEAAQKESNLEIASYDPDEMKQSGELTVFEYAFGVGKAIMDKCKKLFPKVDDEKVDSIGFLILAEILGLTYQEMGKLANRIDSFKKVDFKKLKDAIVDAATIVENSLVPFIDSPTKPKNGKRSSLVCHSELQLASYIIVVFKLKYELSIENGLTNKPKSKDLSKVKDFLYKHYLYDILRNFWSGSGDSKLEAIIADPTTCRYTKDVAKSDFEMVISTWLTESNAKTSMQVSPETKLFLNYLLRRSVPVHEKDSFDIEHCVPKDVIKKHYHKKDIKVPMSTPCNLIFIPTADNRSKGELTYYQRQANAPETFKLDHIQLNKLGYPTKSDLEFVKATSTLTEKNYTQYLKNRRDFLVNRFLELYYKEI